MGNTTKEILKRFWPVLSIVIVWLIFSFPYFFNGLVPFPSRNLVTFFPPWNAAYGMPIKNNAMPDVITQIYPWKKLTIDTWKNGEMPLWNPYSFSGTAHLGNYQTAAFSPFNLLFFILPEIDAWSVMVLLQPLLAGLFMYVFLRSLDRSQTGSLIGSLAFMFCGFLVVWMAYGTLGYAALYLPLILWAITRKRYLWVSVGVALSFFSGHFQISIYVLILAVFYALVFNRPAIIFLFFGILLAAPQILPSLTVYQNSVRGGLTGGEIIPLQYLVTLFAPDFFGNPVTRNDWFGHYAEWASFIGVIPFIFSIHAVTQKRTKQETFFLVTAAIALLFATTPALLWLKIPALSTSAASRIIVITSFSLAVLSSFGVDKLQKTNKKLGFMLLLFLLIVWFVLIFVKPLNPEQLIVAKRNVILPSAIAIVGIVLLWLRKWKSVTLVLLIVLTALDMLRFSVKWMPFDERQYVYPETPVISFLKTRVGNDRIFGNFGNEVASYFGIPSLEGYDAVYQKRYGEFISSLHDGTIGALTRSVVAVDKGGKYTEDVFELLGVRYILHRVSDGRNIWAYPFWNYPNYRQIYKDDWFEVYENSKALPRAFLASNYEIAKTDQEGILKLFASNVSRQKTIILEKVPALVPQEGAGAVTIDQYWATRVKLSVRSDVPKLLFLSDTFDSGWSANVDGKQTEVLRADYDFKAVAVAAGNHTVEFVYQPQSFTVGLAIAIISLALLLVGNIRQLGYAHRVL